jgi:hypothetical protein
VYDNWNIDRTQATKFRNRDGYACFCWFGAGLGGGEAGLEGRVRG